MPVVYTHVVSMPGTLYTPFSNKRVVDISLLIGETDNRSVRLSFDGELYYLRGRYCNNIIYEPPNK
jgi:hypothetical protein